MSVMPRLLGDQIYGSSIGGNHGSLQINVEWPLPICHSDPSFKIQPTCHMLHHVKLRLVPKFDSKNKE